MIVVELKNNLSVRELGGKGYSLGFLIKNNFDVPKGFVIISEAFSKFLKYNGLTEKIEKLASKIDKENFKEESKEIKDLILSGKIPEDIVLEIKGSLNNLNAQHVSIRSSAVSEDSLKTSFAGLYDTFLNVKTKPDLVLKNIKKCWASLFNERVVAYRIGKGFPHLEGMAVVIQEMIPAEISGTTFTAHPDTRDISIMVIECSWGLGEAIVSGLITPDHYIVDKNDLKLIKKVLGRKKIMIKTKENGVVRTNTPEDKTISFCLNDTLIENLAKICLNIERVFKYPQDIEWCIQKNKIWLLQSRYITTLGGDIYEKPKPNHKQ